MKKNSKGFVLIETLIASTFIASIMIYMFVQIKNIKRTYDDVIVYNNSNELYALNYVKKFIVNNSTIYDALALSDSSPTDSDKGAIDFKKFCSSLNVKSECEKVFNDLNIKNLIIVYEDGNFYDNLDSFNFSQTFKKFIQSIKKTNSPDDIRLIGEFNDNFYAELLIHNYHNL